MSDPIKVKVYTLLTLTEPEVTKLLPGAMVAEPVRKGDVHEDIGNRVNVIVIIDGKFAQVPSVAPGEIMDALRSGIRVYGSSSMGAMRAAELHPFGMIGHGEIFEMIRSGIFRDDYLGQLIVPSRIDDLSLTFIDYSFNLKQLERKGLLRARDVARMEKAFGELHFSMRNRASWNHLVDTHFARQPKVARELRSAAAMGSQKKRDAIGLLKRVSKDLDRIRAANEKLSERILDACNEGFNGFWNLESRKSRSGSPGG